MDSGKQGSSETSSEENDQQERVRGDTRSSTKRSYECTFCKRGFTNAQALGGHMNIHRKDRAKAKRVSSGGNSSSVSSKPSNEEEHMNPNYMAQFSSEPTNYFPVLEAQRKYDAYFQPQHGYNNNYHGRHDFVVPIIRPSHHHNQQSALISENEELWGANLSLRIDQAYNNINEANQGVCNKEDEVDLELRLGHDP